MIGINVSQLLKQPPGTTRDFDFTDEGQELAGEVELVAPIEGHAHLLRTSRGILASTRYHTVVRQACGRCLTPTTVEIDGAFEDEFRPTIDVLTGALLPEQAESEELAIDEHHLLNLTEVVRQDLLTRLPLQPLCSPDCPGLCPHCGQDLRAGRCSCERPLETTSPFASLAELLARDESLDESSN